MFRGFNKNQEYLMDLFFVYFQFAMDAYIACLHILALFIIWRVKLYLTNIT